MGAPVVVVEVMLALALRGNACAWCRVCSGGGVEARVCAHARCCLSGVRRATISPTCDPLEGGADCSRCKYIEYYHDMNGFSWSHWRSRTLSVMLSVTAIDEEEGSSHTWAFDGQIDR